MKYLQYALGISLLIAVSSCRNEGVDTPVYSPVGVWQPVKEVRTYTALDNTAYTETYAYGDCEKTTRYTFSADNSGYLVKNAMRNATCLEEYSTTLTYSYNHEDGKFVMESTYNGHEEGELAFQNSEVMNLKIVTQDPNTSIITHTVYTLNKVE